MTRVIVTGAGGFIGPHLVTYLKDRGTGFGDRHQGARVRPWRRRRVPAGRPAPPDACLRGPIEDRRGLRAGRRHGRHGLHLQPPRRDPAQQLADQHPHAGGGPRRRRERYLYTSSACIYPEYLQTETDVAPLGRRTPTRPHPQDAYGWEKLFTEQLCEYYPQEYGMETRDRALPQHLRAAGTWDGGREKAPAAMCRKVAHGRADRRPDRDLGRRRADPLVLLHRRLRRGHLPADALRLSPSRSTSGRTAWSRSTSSPSIVIDDRREGDIAIEHVEGPQGVRGRNSDNTSLREVLGWEPAIAWQGLVPTYRWIEKQLDAR